MVWFRWGCTASCGWNVRCVGVRGDAWPVLLSPCNTNSSTEIEAKELWNACRNVHQALRTVSPFAASLGTSHGVACASCKCKCMLPRHVNADLLVGALRVVGALWRGQEW